MSSRARQVLFASLAVLLPVLLLLLGIWLGGHPSNLPSFARKVFVANNETQGVDEAMELASDDYYRPLSNSALATPSVAGLISSLHDPYSESLRQKEFPRFDQPASFAGIGVSV